MDVASGHHSARDSPLRFPEHYDYCRGSRSIPLAMNIGTRPSPRRYPMGAPNARLRDEPSGENGVETTQTRRRIPIAVR
jgi:hypothetical protein